MALPTYFAIFTCYIGVLHTVFILGFTSPTQKQLIQDGILSTNTLSLFASIPHISAILSIFLIPILVQFKFNLNIISVVGQLSGGAGWLLVVVSDRNYLIISGMALLGFYFSINAIFINTYLGEVTLGHQRKIAGGGVGLTIRIGLFIVYGLGIWLSFRWLAVVGFLVMLTFNLLLFCSPISPVWLVTNGLDQRAKSTMKYLYGAEFDADSEIQNIKNNNLSNKLGWKESFKALKSWEVLKRILLMCMIGSLKELGGHEAMVSFTSHILENQTGMDPKVAALFYPTFLVAGAIVSISIMKYCKLKWLLISASTLMTLSHLSMSVYYMVSEKYLNCGVDYSDLCRIISFWPISNVAVYAFGFTLGWGLVYFALFGIVFVSHREISTTIVCFVETISMFTIINLFYYLLQTIGGSGAFLFLAFVNLISIFFVYFFMKI